MIILDMPSASFRCLVLVKSDTGSTTYRIDNIVNPAHPFHLLKRANAIWASLSLCASIEACIGVLQKDLLSSGLADKINHGQAKIESEALLSRIHLGERRIELVTRVTAAYRDCAK